jgi:hypothetical protein
VLKLYKEAITVDEVISLLNEIIKIDEEVIHQLIMYRVPCNETLANHNTIQVDELYVGLLGILNGFFGVQEDHTGIIGCVIDTDTNKIIRFEKRV